MFKSTLVPPQACRVPSCPGMSATRAPASTTVSYVTTATIALTSLTNSGLFVHRISTAVTSNMDSALTGRKRSLIMRTGYSWRLRQIRWVLCQMGIIPTPRVMVSLTFGIGWCQFWWIRKRSFHVFLSSSRFRTLLGIQWPPYKGIDRADSAASLPGHSWNICKMLIQVLVSSKRTKSRNH